MKGLQTEKESKTRTRRLAETPVAKAIIAMVTQDKETADQDWHMVTLSAWR